MPIKLPISERELRRARQILSSWTPKRLSSDEADIIVRMIAQGIAEGRRYGFVEAEAEEPAAGRNHLQELKDDLGAKL
ncbi:hypothetical protein QA640_34130 [Bradyrhizobium sp. CB82]|uniref:hypothetical protein n=1 Tax=Bradyrhizobium sp. CB82 TaxID=3039159 RepID=UPI0024B0471D|nr:hypothetical protein [Bradyrhizobium sp. CB82]WFU39363.1 hypothetical protein QA640_34130 [Bradyrhizobium sp. CB82]